MGNFTSKSSKNGREIHMIPTHSCSFAYKTYYFLFFTFVCFCFCVVAGFCYCCCCFLRSCCCRVVGSRSESENVAKKWIYVLPVFIAVITISKVGVQKTILNFVVACLCDVLQIMCWMCVDKWSHSIQGANSWGDFLRNVFDLCWTRRGSH